MRRFPIWTFFIVLCFKAIGSPAFFNYEVSGIPNGVSDCIGIGNEISGRFEKLTSVIPTAVKSVQDTPASCRIKITYVSEHPLSLISTISRKPLSELGAYESYSACESVRSDRTKMFEENTGLAPVVSYCQLVSPNTNRPFSVRIESFGNPKLSPQFSDHVIDFGRALTNASQVENQVRKNLERYGVGVSDVSLKGPLGGGWFNYLSFSYYGIYARTFEILRPFTFTSVAACESAAGALPSYFNKAAAPLFGSFCTTQYGKSSLNFLIERPLQLSIAPPPDHETYESQIACEADRSRVETAYSKIEWEVFGTLCGPVESRYEMIVFGRGKKNFVEGKMRRPLPWTEVVTASRTSFSEGSARSLAEGDLRAGGIQEKAICKSDQGSFSVSGGAVSCSKQGVQFTCRGYETCQCKRTL